MIPMAPTSEAEKTGMFVLAKVLDVLATPLSMLFVTLLVLALLGFSRWHRALPGALAALVAVLALIAMIPWPDLVLRPLENRFPQTEPPAHVDGIVVLGGAIDPVISQERGHPAVNAAVERINALIVLGRRYPDAKLVFTGGSGRIDRQEAKEAPQVRRYLGDLGFDADRVIYEEQSRNTWENAVLTQALVQPKPGETWILVTSALHMPRAMGVFAAIDWPVSAYPVDYLTGSSDFSFRFNLPGAFSAIGASLHEGVGLVYYRARGWTNRLFPSP